METISVTVLLCHYKLSSGRSVSEAALRFGNLCVYESNALRKKLPDLRHSCAANTFQRNVPNVNVIFLTHTVGSLWEIWGCD